MRKLQLNFETFGAIGAIIVSVAALFVAWDQARVMRVQQHAAVIPILTVDMTVDQDTDNNIINLSMTNVGVGPAMVISATPTLNDEPISSFDQLQEQLFEEDFQETMRISASSPTTVMGVGEVIDVLGLRWQRTEEGDAAIVRLAQGIGNDTLPTLSVELCYCSVFERCWVTGRSDLSYPESVETCTPSGDFLRSFFQNTSINGDNTEAATDVEDAQ